MNSRSVNGRSSSPVVVVVVLAGVTDVTGVTGVTGVVVASIGISLVADPGAGSAGTGGLVLDTGTGLTTRLGGGELTLSGACIRCKSTAYRYDSISQ